MIKISTSFLSMRDDLKESVVKFNNFDIDYTHLDIMDSIFVPYSSYNDSEIEEIIENSNKKLDVHLMVQDIDKYIEKYFNNKTKYITIHYEVLKDLNILNKIRKQGIKSGISIKPNTNVEEIYGLLDLVDLVLIMSVEPGRGGQSFMSGSLEKISKLKNEIKRKGLTTKISVDGGINDTNIDDCIKSGVDIIVIGSYFDRCNDIKAFISKAKSVKL